MTISIKTEIFTADVNDDLFVNFQPMPEEYDIRINRTQSMIDEKKAALTFAADMIYRVEQPWLVYQEEGTNYILNGVTRYLALKELYEADENGFAFTPIPYMVLEDGWTEDELKSLQHSANNFGTKTDEIVIARESIFLYEDEYEKEVEKIKANKEVDDKGKVLKGKKLENEASLRAQATLMASPIFRGKTKRHFFRYKNIIQRGTDKLQQFIEDGLMTVRIGDETIVDYNNKYLKACKSNEEKPKSLDFILDVVLMDVKSAIDSENEKTKEKYDKLSEEQKNETELELKPYVIQKKDVDAWFKANTPKKLGKESIDESGESGESGDIPVDVKEVKESYEAVRNFALNFERTEDDSVNRLRELSDVLESQMELASVAISTLPTKDIEPLFDELFTASASLIASLPAITPNTTKLKELSSKIKKCKKQIDNFYISAQTKEANSMEEVETDELTEEIDGFTVSAK